MLRDVLGGIAGIAIAVLIVFLADMLSHNVFPPPENLDFTDVDALRPYIATLPIGAFLIVMGGPIIGTFVGVIVASRIGTPKVWVYPAAVGGLMFAGTVSNLITIPHPLWFSIISLLGILASGWLAMQLAKLNGTGSNGD